MKGTINATPKEYKPAFLSCVLLKVIILERNNNQGTLLQTL